MGKLALYWPDHYTINLQSIPYLLCGQGIEKIMTLELWYMKGETAGNPLIGLELTAGMLGEDMAGGKDMLENGYLQIRQGGSTDVWTVLDGSNTFYIGNMEVNTMYPLEIRIMIPEGALSQGKVGWRLLEMNSSGDVQEDLDGEFAIAYDISGNEILDDGIMAVLYGDGIYGAEYRDYNHHDKHQFSIIMTAFIMDIVDIARRREGGWILNLN